VKCTSFGRIASLCITTRLQIIRVYAQSVPNIHGHLDAVPLADSRIKG